MTESPATYPNYKPSDVSWIGHVPTHWEVRRLKADVSDVVDLTNHRKRNESYVALEHVESWTGRIMESESDATFENQVKRFRPGDVLFGKLRPYLAKVTHAQRHGVCVGEFLVLRPHHATVDPSYLTRLIRSKPAIGAIDASTFGAKMPRADWQFIGSMLVPIPPLDEQSTIVRYLDHADELINRYISAKERLIALLQEQRQAVIHQAVTRGLDLNVQLKPSDIPWIGDVPTHWEISRTKNEFQSLNHRRVPLSSTERGSMTLRRYDYYGASGVIDKVDSYLFDDELLLIAEDGANLVLRNSPLAIIARGQFWVNNHAHILKPRRGNLDFLAAVMQGINYTPWISGAAQPKLTSDRLMGISIAVPSRSEQDDIMEQTKKLTSPITSSIKRTQRQLTLMEEYRTRLIADVVTGQIDVRDAAVELPV